MDVYYCLAHVHANCIWSSASLNIKKNTFARSTAAYHVPKAVRFDLSKDTVSGTAAVAGDYFLDKFAVLYYHLPRPIHFWQRPDLLAKSPYNKVHWHTDC